ncbi:hypothetical protein CIRG_00901 [Coccidioides immitis RMSCC 2394]|uniref:Secreted protein n=1 Tax=Coccidioides immitis RMSCC 2394 TaxID=404692 RepID=A0A0J6Y183_COCIT|nr:hypothetical protein CIRG_00901 [Coccidioides immitis RMSCC 2394]
MTRWPILGLLTATASWASTACDESPGAELVPAADLWHGRGRAEIDRPLPPNDGARAGANQPLLTWTAMQGQKKKNARAGRGLSWGLAARMFFPLLFGGISTS